MIQREQKKMSSVIKIEYWREKKICRSSDLLSLSFPSESSFADLLILCVSSSKRSTCFERI